jgi:hypothetical protein
MIINLSCYVLLYNEKGKQHTVGTIRNSNQQMVDINTIDSINTYIHDHSAVSKTGFVSDPHVLDTLGTVGTGTVAGTAKNKNSLFSFSIYTVPLW